MKLMHGNLRALVFDQLGNRSAWRMVMPWTIFTRRDVRKINADVIAGKGRDTSNLSPVSQRILRETTFTAEEINAAYAAARLACSGTSGPPA